MVLQTKDEVGNTVGIYDTLGAERNDKGTLFFAVALSLALVFGVALYALNGANYTTKPASVMAADSAARHDTDAARTLPNFEVIPVK